MTRIFIKPAGGYCILMACVACRFMVFWPCWVLYELSNWGIWLGELMKSLRGRNGYPHQPGCLSTKLLFLQPFFEVIGYYPWRVTCESISSDGFEETASTEQSDTKKRWMRGITIWEVGCSAPKDVICGDGERPLTNLFLKICLASCRRFSIHRL